MISAYKFEVLVSHFFRIVGVVLKIRPFCGNTLSLSLSVSLSLTQTHISLYYGESRDKVPIVSHFDDYNKVPSR